MQKAFVLVCSALFLACGVQKAFTVSDAGSDTDTDSDSDTDSDTDIDSDSDTDTDTDSDTDEDAGTDTDTDTDTDSDTEEPTVCATSDDCDVDEGEACDLVTFTCFTPTEPGQGQLQQCWDEGLTCDAHDDGWCNYWSPPNWNAVGDVPACGSDNPPPTCPTRYPDNPACCLKDIGFDDCLEDSFNLPD
jgi:hypothetical protein